MASGHALFQQFALRGEVALSTGPAPKPYHVYDGHGTLVLGTCDGAVLQTAFAGQDVYPVLTPAGQGIIILFLCDFHTASHGPHDECHITALAAPTMGQTLTGGPEAALAALALRHDWGVLSLHLWNNSPSVVACNTEHLGLQAQLSHSAVQVTGDAVTFEIAGDDATPVVAGRLRRNTRSDGSEMWRVLRALRLKGLWHMAHNGRAQTRAAADQTVLTAFDPQRDRIDAPRGPLALLGFVPQLFEHVTPFRFVSLHPDHRVT